MRSRRVKGIAAALVLAGAVWGAAYFVSPLVAGIVSFVVATAFGTVIARHVPAVWERLVGTEPLNALAGSDSGFYSDGWSVVLPQDVETSTTPPDGLEHVQARNWLFGVGAYDLRQSHLLLTLEGRSDDVVRITALRAHVRQRLAPLSGAVVCSPSAGERRIAGAEFDLDQDVSSARTEEGHGYFDSYGLTIGRGEVFIFRIVARTEKSACEWDLVVGYTHRGVKHELTVDNAGRLFRTASAKPGRPSYHWAWYEQPARLIPEPHY